MPANELWSRQASLWNCLGPPLRPAAEDIAIVRRAVLEWSLYHGAPRALILGVTPELAKLPWARGASLLAIDRSQMMIERVWPGFPRPGMGAICGDWLTMPLDTESRDVVLADGIFVQLPIPQAHRQLLEKLASILSPTGRFVVRMFVLPQTKESPAEVLNFCRVGEIDTVHEFKIRLLMAMQESSSSGVKLGDVWQYWNAHRQQLSGKQGTGRWPADQVATLEAYRDQAARYYFCDLAEMRAMFRKWFVEVDCRIPAYRLGDRFPTFVLASRNRALAFHRKAA
jgi:hypothetical protein